MAKILLTNKGVKQSNVLML